MSRRVKYGRAVPGSGRPGRARSAGPRRALLLGVALSTVLMVSPPARAAGGATFRASLEPPGLLVQGQPATVSVAVQPYIPAYDAMVGDAFVRGDPQGTFTRVPLVWNGDRQSLSARIPASALAGSILDEYAVVHRPGGEPVSVPPAGADGPYRSWVLPAGGPTVSLGKHRFGHVRAPDAIVARARAGDGPGEVGFLSQDISEAPESFDVGPDGAIWVVDENHTRLLEWDAGHPGKPSRTIPLSFGPADVAVGIDGTVYVSGGAGGDADHHTRVYAFAPDGRQIWLGRLLSGYFDTQLRIGPDGILYGVDPTHGWVPATDAGGRPLDLATQRDAATPYEPVAAGGELVVSGESRECTPCSSPRADVRVGAARSSGGLRRSWRLLSADAWDAFDIHGQDTTPALVGGDPVVVFAIYDFKKHLMEHLVLRLSPTGGVEERFSLGRGAWGDPVTSTRVASDGALYQMQTDPSFGLRIARYSLGGAPSPTPTPTTTPSAVPSPTPPTAAAPSEPQSGGPSSRTWLTLGVAGAAIVGVPALLLWWRRRRAAGSPAGGSAG